MSCGKYLSLEEARKTGQLDRFCKEHQSTGDHDLFDHILGQMTKIREEASETSPRGKRVRSTETQTRQDT
jgi:hypothetical protein